MAERSKISWTDASFTPWIGCEKISPACRGCYAEALDLRWHGGNHWGPGAPRRMMAESYWAQLASWNRQVQKWKHLRSVGNLPPEGEKLPRGVKAAPFHVFIGHLCDVFEEYHGPSEREVDAARARLFAEIAGRPHLTFLLLTKRPWNVENFVPATWRDEWPANAWLGITAEDQDNFDERVREVASLKYRFDIPTVYLSVEPALGPIALDPWLRQIDWVIVGGESQPGCRPFDPGIARNLLVQCRQGEVPFFMKQLGGHPDPRGKLEDLPEDLRVREWPAVNSATENPEEAGR